MAFDFRNLNVLIFKARWMEPERQDLVMGVMLEDYLVKGKKIFVMLII